MTDAPRRTWVDLAMSAGATSHEEAESLLWSGTAFPCSQSPRYIWGQLRHVIRHKVCFDDPMAHCQSRRLERYT